ncbi:hypothetical protein F5Y16DRAFT_403849 [Xylariaceae sp. FL0255]|nr:hypothetical protein F5Y16DRAFT_403849 [Xylariaceae sp. FL0255]
MSPVRVLPINYGSDHDVLRTCLEEELGTGDFTIIGFKSDQWHVDLPIDITISDDQIEKVRTKMRRHYRRSKSRK